MCYVRVKGVQKLIVFHLDQKGVPDITPFVIALDEIVINLSVY